MRKRRKASEATDEVADTATGADAGPQVEGPRAHGPWDDSEVPVDEEDTTRAHLGSLSIKGRQDVEVRLQVDEASGRVAAVMLVGSDGAMELRAFAAPRNEDIWPDVRRQMAAEATRRGGTATEVEGPYGTALQLVVSGTGPDGQAVRQPSTVLGIAGPRWLLRVSMLGRPALEYRPDAPLESCLRDVVVIRGNAPMPPGEALPLVLPSRARRVDQAG